MLGCVCVCVFTRECGAVQRCGWRAAVAAWTACLAAAAEGSGGGDQSPE